MVPAVLTCAVEAEGHRRAASSAAEKVPSGVWILTVTPVPSTSRPGLAITNQYIGYFLPPWYSTELTLATVPSYTLQVVGYEQGSLLPLLMLEEELRLKEAWTCIWVYR